MVEEKKVSINDYDILKSIGTGAFGTVYLSKEKESGKLFAIKALNKDHIVKTGKTKHVFREKEILSLLNSH